MIRLGRRGLVKLSVTVFFLVCCRTLLCFPIWRNPQIITIEPRKSIRLELRALIQQALQVANTSATLYKYSSRNATHIELQKFLGCLVNLAVVSDDDMEANDVLSHSSGLNTSASCSQLRSIPLTDFWNIPMLCRHLIGMRILLVGSHMTYRLHNKLLDILPSGSQGSQFRCHSPALCTWHEICSSSPQPHMPLSSERRRMPPQDLSNSAILRFSMSSTLLNKVPDEENYQPYTSPLTGVREHDTQDWLEKARRSDMIILAKSPVPAPAWSYLSSSIPRPHFNVRIPRPGSPEWNSMEPFISLLVPQGVLRDASVVQAAWKATIVKWLPELIETLVCLQTEEVAMKGKLLVWLGSSFVTGRAGGQEAPNNRTDIQWLRDCIGEDRCIFENAQVYIQNLLLHQILPRLGIFYIPVANPSPSRPKPSSGMLSENNRRANVFAFENVTSMTKSHDAEDVFLRGLIAILRWRKTGKVHEDDGL